MNRVASLSPAVVVDPVAAALAVLEAAGIQATESALAILRDRGVSLCDDGAQPVVVELLCHVLEALEADPAALAVHRFYAMLDQASAETAHNLLLLANFPNGEGVLAELPDATVLCLAGLINAAGRGADADALLETAKAERPSPRFKSAVRATRLRFLGLAPGIGALWTAPCGFGGAIEDLPGIIEANPLEIVAHRALARHLAEAGQFDRSLAILARAIALPVADDARRGLAADLAVMAVHLCGDGKSASFGTESMVFALAAAPRVAAEAAALLAAPPGSAEWRSIDADVLKEVRGYFEHFRDTPRPAYPAVGGRPHIDIVWLEITNFCNQKCGFCPDMHREDARQWLPLEQVKQIIDQLATTVHVGSMQLNAYGEPLLHPNIAEILAYIRKKALPFPTFFTTHGMTLVEKKLAQLSHNYPTGIAVSLHNDSQQSYAATRSAKIGDYDTLVDRVSALLAQMAHEGAPGHLRLYQMVSNGAEDKRVDPRVRGAFPDSPDRMMRHVRKWENIAAKIAAGAPADRRVKALTNQPEMIEASFFGASHGDQGHLPVLKWRDVDGKDQFAFISPRPVGTYANLLLEHHPDWSVGRRMINADGNRCGFVQKPSLAIFATGKLGICCLDMDSTATFGSLSDFDGIRAAVESPQARKIFAELANGVATSKGCQICLAGNDQICGPRYG